MNKILIINSKDRQNYEISDTGSFRIFFNQPLYDEKKTVHVSLQGVSIPKSFFNITSTNRTFQLTIADETYALVLSNGYYTITSLCSALETLLNNFDEDYTDFEVTCVPSNQTVIISSTANEFIIVNTELSKLLGFYIASGQDYELSYTSNGSIQFFTQHMFLYLDIPQFEKVIYDSRNNCLSTFLIPLTNMSPSQIDQTGNIYIDYLILNSVNVDVEMRDPRLNFIDIRVLDSDLNVVNMRNGDFMLVFKFY